MVAVVERGAYLPQEPLVSDGLRLSSSEPLMKGAIMRNRLILVAIVMVLGSLLLAGCAIQTGGQTSAAKSTATTAPTAMPSPTPSPTPVP